MVSAGKVAIVLIRDYDLSAAPAVLEGVKSFLQREFIMRQEFDEATGLRELRKAWLDRTRKYVGDLCTSLNATAAKLQDKDAALKLVANLRAELNQLRNENCDAFQRESTARWHVENLEDRRGPAIICEGSDEAGCRETIVKHFVRPWLNQWQLDFLALFELDHVIEKRVLYPWVARAFSRAATESIGFVVDADVVFSYFCTERNLRVAWRKPCHSRSRHPDDPPAEVALKQAHQ